MVSTVTYTDGHCSVCKKAVKAPSRGAHSKNHNAEAKADTSKYITLIPCIYHLNYCRKEGISPRQKNHQWV